MLTAKDTHKVMTQEMKHIMDHARTLVNATSGEVDDRVKAARAALKEGLDSVQIEYGGLEDQLLVKAREADHFIHVKPYYAIGGTFIAGLFLGWFMSRN